MRPKRERRKPERFGDLVPSAVEEDAEEEPERPAKRRRAASEPSEANGQAGGRRHKAAGAAALAPPTSRHDVLACLHACPELMADNLRSVTLLARDAASLAIALCAGGEDMGEMWRQLARACEGGGAVTHITPPAEVLQVVQNAVAADPVRNERCCLSAAKGDYRLSDTDLAPLTFVTKRNPHYRGAAPMKLYNVLDVMSVAHRKYGCAEVMEEARQKARARYEKAAATQSGNQERRRGELAAALEKEGLEPSRYRYQREATAYVKHGQGEPAAIARMMKEQAEQERARQQRMEQLRVRLTAEGLAAELYRSLAARRFIQSGSSSADAAEGGTGGSQAAGAALDEVVVAVKAEVEQQRQRAARRARIDELLAAEGLAGWGWLHAVQSYVHSGTASEEAVIADVRAAHEARQAELAAVTAALQADLQALQHAAAVAVHAAAGSP